MLLSVNSRRRIGNRNKGFALPMTFKNSVKIARPSTECNLKEFSNITSIVNCELLNARPLICTAEKNKNQR